MMNLLNEKDVLRKRMQFRIQHFEPEVHHFVYELETKLRTLGKIVPDGILVLGGSLARGEPCIRFSEGKYKLFSDYDIVYILSEGEELGSLKSLKTLCQDKLVYDVSIFALKQAEFKRLQTSIGWDLKFRGIILNTYSNFIFEAFNVTHRDATDIFIFAIQEFFERDIAKAGLKQMPYDDNLIYALHRLYLNALRSVVMLENGNDYHDIMKSSLLSEDCIEVAVRHLRWRISDESNGFIPSFKDCVNALLKCEDIHKKYGHLAIASNTVDFSRYAYSTYANYIKSVQSVAFELWNGMRVILPNVEDWFSPVNVLQAQRDSWQNVTKIYSIINCDAADPGKWFNAVSKPYREALLKMKVEKSMANIKTN